MIATLLAATLAVAAPNPAHAELQSVLRAKDQALLDAVGQGDRSIWEQTLAPHAIYVDENGTVMARAAFIDALGPLPPGISGSIKITDYQLVINGDTAFVIHKDEEHEVYHGQALEANYLSTETWLHRDGQWKLALVHAYVVAKDPPSIKVNPAKLEAYVGRYRAAPGIVYVIRRHGDQLTGGREGGKPQPLKVETTDVLFTPGQPRVRKIFQRDKNGKVTGFLYRREGEDLRWTRIQ